MVGAVMMAPWVLLKCVTFGLFVVTVFVIACANALLLWSLKIVYRRFKEKIACEYGRLF